MNKPLETIRSEVLFYIISKYNIILEDAEDVVSQAIYIYLQNKEEIKSVKSFLITTAKNLIYKLYKRNNVENRNLRAVFSNYYHKILDNKGPIDINKYDIEELKKIVPKQYHNLLDAIPDSNNMVELAKKLSVNYNSLKSRIYIIKTYLQVADLVERGIVLSKHLVNHKQKRAFLFFMQSFAQTCKTQEKGDLKKYFKDDLPKDFNLDFDIKRIIKCEFQLRDDNSYYTQVFYSNSNDDVQGLYFRFFFHKDKLKLLTPPIKARKFTKIPKEKINKLKQHISINTEERTSSFSKFEQEIIGQICDPDDIKDPEPTKE